MLPGVCLNLFGFYLARDTSWIDRFVVNHESIHDAQQKELLWIPFYILYILEWIWRLIIHRDFDKAYRNISFEKEAYRNDRNLNYLSERRHFAQWRNLKK